MKKSKYSTKVLNINNNTAFLLGSGFTENGQFPFIDKINFEKNSKESCTNLRLQKNTKI